MQQQVSVVTVGVNNLVLSRHFYVDGFGWTPAFENEQIIFYQMNGFVFGTWLALALADDMRRPLSTPGAFALGHNVPTRKEVQATMTLSWWLVCIGSGSNMAPHLHICSANFLHCLLCGRANPFRQTALRYAWKLVFYRSQFSRSVAPTFALARDRRRSPNWRSSRRQRRAGQRPRKGAWCEVT